MIVTSVLLVNRTIDYSFIRDFTQDTYRRCTTRERSSKSFSGTSLLLTSLVSVLLVRKCYAGNHQSMRRRLCDAAEERSSDEARSLHDATDTVSQFVLLLAKITLSWLTSFKCDGHLMVMN